MLLPDSRPWTLRQRWLIAGAVAAGVVAFSALVYSYERYYRGPNDSFFVGTWRGEQIPTGLFLGDPNVALHFRADHTFEGEGIPSGKWFGGGEFLYLRFLLDDGRPYEELQQW